MMNLDSFYLAQAEPNQSCLLALRAQILAFNSLMQESLKYGMPCFSMGKKPLFYLWTDKRTNWPYVLFVDGKLVNHPALETGSRKRMKIWLVDPYKDVNLPLLISLLRQAVPNIGE